MHISTATQDTQPNAGSHPARRLSEEPSLKVQTEYRETCHTTMVSVGVTSAPFGWAGFKEPVCVSSRRTEATAETRLPLANLSSVSAVWCRQRRFGEAVNSNTCHTNAGSSRLWHHFKREVNRTKEEESLKWCKVYWLEASNPPTHKCPSCKIQIIDTFSCVNNQFEPCCKTDRGASLSDGTRSDSIKTSCSV